MVKIAHRGAGYPVVTHLSYVGTLQGISHHGHEEHASPAQLLYHGIPQRQPNMLGKGYIPILKCSNIRMQGE